MSEAIIVAVITGACAIIAQAIIAHGSQKDIYAKLDKTQAVTDTNLDELTREVREHNNFARRLPVLEEQMRVLSTRMDRLEGQRHAE